MNNRTTSQACGEQVTSGASAQRRYQQIQLAMDVHTASMVAVRRVDGAKPQPPQTFKPAAFLAWVCQQRLQAREAISC